MSHSCAPNCAHSVFPNKTLALQVKIDAVDGDDNDGAVGGDDADDDDD